MDKSFWIKNWDDNNIGFHSKDVNDLLLKHIVNFPLKKNSKILVPLCGKSVDLIYLAKLGHTITGFELSKKAVLSFFSENNFKYAKKNEGVFTRYTCSDLPIEIFQGDFFALNLIESFDFIYDRAALIALPEDMRISYSKIITDTLGTGAFMLLITAEYESSKLIGPPFSVTQKEVNNLYKKNFEIILLEKLEKEITGPRFQDEGVESAKRLVYKMIKK